MTPLLELWFAAFPAVVLLFTPFLASTVTALLCAVIHSRLKRSGELGEPAGDWLTALVHRQGPGITVGVAPEIFGSMDGYWPQTRFIGLSPRTWLDCSPAGRAIAAHELGHALAWDRDGERARWLARGRQLLHHSLAVAGAGLVTAALLDSLFAAQVAFAALGFALLGHGATLLDEADASRRGAQILDAHGLRSRGTDLAMLAAWCVYLTPAAVHLGTLFAFPWVLDALLTPSPLAHSNSAIGLWAILLLAPFLLLRAAQVLMDSTQPAPISTEFSLNWSLFQERSWEFHSGIIVLLWIALCYDEPISAGLAPLFLLGAIPAMGPLGALGRLVVVLPIFFVLALFGFIQQPDRGRQIRAPRPRDPLTVITTEAPPIARAVGLVRLSWLPLLAVLFTRAVSGW